MDSKKAIAVAAILCAGMVTEDDGQNAVMVEEVARTVHIARQLGEPVPIDPDLVDSLYARYQNVYGQH